MYVFLPYKVINQIKHDTIRVAPKEVGGYLLGVTLGEDRFVTHAIASSQPGTKVEATIATPVMMPLYQPYLERYGGEVLAIGIFHSHPHHFLSYSPTDVEMHINMEQWDSKDLISIVIDPYKEENAFTVMSLDEKGTVLKVPAYLLWGHSNCIVWYLIDNFVR